jgi:hypothetical protein
MYSGSNGRRQTKGKARPVEARAVEQAVLAEAVSQPAQKETARDRVGDGLLSHAVTRILPSALAGLTSGFGMGPGVPPPLLSPTLPSPSFPSSGRNSHGPRG